MRRRVLAKPFLQCEKLRLERRPGREGVEEIALLHHRANRVVAGLKGRELARRFLPRPTVGRHFKEAPELEEELVEVLSPSDIRMGIWERGVGETASSGTGSSASAVASIWNGLAKSPVHVHCPGGVMTVEWEEGGDVFLEGDASIVAEGDYFFQGTTVTP